MRETLTTVFEAGGRQLRSYDFDALRDRQGVDSELQRLIDDGLAEGELSFDRYGVCLVFRIDGLTPEGEAFYKLIENDEVWRIVSDTLAKADIDVSYPLLKEVCEEIVKRYVTSFIPEL